MSTTTTTTTAAADQLAVPTSRRVATVAATAAGAAFTVKVALILATDNAISETVTGVLYLAGLVLGLVAAGAYAATRDTGRLRKVGTFLLLAVGFLFYITMLSDGVGAVVAPFSDAEHMQDEVPVAVIGAVWLAAALRLARRGG